MTWCGEYPEAAIAEVVERLFEWTELLPTSVQLIPLLRQIMWIKEAAIPLQTRIFQVPGRACCSGARTKIRCGVGEDMADRSRVIPVRVAVMVNGEFERSDLLT
jgi:hypothetical protein